MADCSDSKPFSSVRFEKGKGVGALLGTIRKFRLFGPVAFPGDGDFALPDFELTAQAHAFFEVFFVEVFFFFFGKLIEEEA